MSAQTRSTTAPTAPAVGDVWYDETAGVQFWKTWTGVAWVASSLATIDSAYASIYSGALAINETALTEGVFPATLARDAETTAAIAAQATTDATLYAKLLAGLLAVNGVNLTEAAFPATLARDAETTAAIAALDALVLHLTGGTMGEAANIVLGTATGTKIGTAANQKLGFYNAAPVIQPAALTQTYATTSRTNPALTSAAVATTAATQVTPYGYAQAQADAIPVAINALRTDLNNIKNFVNAIADDLQLVGLEA